MDLRNGDVVLTSGMIDAAKTARGGYTKQQLSAVGVSWPPQSGWKESLAGKTVSKDSYDDFCRGLNPPDPTSAPAS